MVETNKTQSLVYDRIVEHIKIVIISLSQIRYSLVVILGLNSVSEVQYKDMMIDR